MNALTKNFLTEIAPPGSSLYYSLLHCDEHSRKKIIALRGFYQTVQKIPSQSQDPSIVQIKFQWWREELARLKTQTAQHPITKILQDDFHHHADLETILNAFIEDTKISLYENESDLDKFYQNTAGLLEKLLYNITDQKILNNLSNLGIFIQKISHLRDLRTALSRGKIYLSGEQLLQHRVNLYELSQLKLTKNINNLFKSEADNIHHYYHQNLNHLHTLSLPTSTLILAKIHKKLLNEIEQTNFQILSHKISLTPLRKWWIAFRENLFSQKIKN